ncbi:MAG: cytochrome c4 [Methyloceanibacter sp.]
MQQSFRRAAMALSALIALAGGHAMAQDGQSIEEKAKLCATCHGEQGIPINKETPVIWGQNEGYLFLQLRDYKTGTRKNDVMSAMVASLEREDMLALAAYFTKQKWPNLQQPSASAALSAKAEQASASVGCKGCHLDHFQGDGTTARLAGQWQEYLQKTMMEFRDTTRGNNPGMSNLMQATAPDDIAALAEYLAGLQIDQYLGNGR